MATPAGRRQEADDVHHVEVGLGLAAGQPLVRRAEAVRDLGAVRDGEVRAAVGDVEPGRPPRRLDPVHDPGDPVARPEHVAGLEVAVQERAVVRRRVHARGSRTPASQAAGSRAQSGTTYLAGHRPRLVGPRPPTGRSAWISASAACQRLEVGVRRPVEIDVAREQRHQVGGLAGSRAVGVERDRARRWHIGTGQHQLGLVLARRQLGAVRAPGFVGHQPQHGPVAAGRGERQHRGRRSRQ